MKIQFKKMAWVLALMMTITLFGSKVSAAGSRYSSAIGGNKTTTFDKYLVMREGTEVPNASFQFTIAPGTAQSYDLASGKLEVLSGIGTPTITWDHAGAQADGKLYELITRLVKLNGEKEDITCSGDLIMYAGVPLRQSFSGTGVSDEVGYMPDFGTRLYVIKAQDQPLPLGGG